MKRSEVNEILAWAKKMLARYQIVLPPFGYWSPEDWESKGAECDEIRECGLGWDITDFGLGDFRHYGLTLFTCRNGHPTDSRWPKPYCEKLMIAMPIQRTPMHYHQQKTEDIIVRAGGNLVVKLRQECHHEGLLGDISVSTDGIERSIPSAGQIILHPGESITLPPYLYHEFWAAKGGLPCVIGEVSTVNDDANDNFFLKEVGRFPEIEEDEPPVYYLCTEYPPAK
jgi:hypothetical protein